MRFLTSLRWFVNPVVYGGYCHMTTAYSSGYTATPPPPPHLSPPPPPPKQNPGCATETVSANCVTLLQTVRCLTKGLRYRLQTIRRRYRDDDRVSSKLLLGRDVARHHALHDSGEERLHGHATTRRFLKLLVTATRLRLHIHSFFIT